MEPRNVSTRKVLLHKKNTINCGGTYELYTLCVHHKCVLHEAHGVGARVKDCVFTMGSQSAYYFILAHFMQTFNYLLSHAANAKRMEKNTRTHIFDVESITMRPQIATANELCG